MPSFALYWGIFDDYKENKNEYAVVKFINNTPIKYAITTELFNTNNTQSKNTNNNEALFKEQIGSTLQQEQTLNNMIVEAFNTWPKDTLATIKDKNNNREKEFSDITPLLSRPKGVNLQRVAKNENPDIIFYFLNSKKRIKKICTEESVACIERKQHPVKVYILNPYAVDIKDFHLQKNYTLSDLIHEIGHYFALTDQIKEFQSASDINHSTADRFVTGISLMASSNDTILTCDDIDGFINVIDLTWALMHNNNFTDRASKGWNSFCNGKKAPNGVLYDETKYAKAKIINQPIRFYFGTRCFNQFDKNGNFIKEVCAPSTDFDFYNKDLTYNIHGLVETKKDGAFIYEYKYTITKKSKTPIIKVNYYLKDNYPANDYIFSDICTYNPDTKGWLLSSCKAVNDDYDSVLYYNKDSIEYAIFSCDGKTMSSYFFDQKGKFFKSKFAFKIKKDSKKSWGIIKGKSCSIYIKENGKENLSNADAIAKEFNYDKTKIKKLIDDTCSKPEQEITKMPTINYFIKIKKYFHIN